MQRFIWSWRKGWSVVGFGQDTPPDMRVGRWAAMVLCARAIFVRRHLPTAGEVCPGWKYFSLFGRNETMSPLWQHIFLEHSLLLFSLRLRRLSLPSFSLFGITQRNDNASPISHAATTGHEYLCHREYQHSQLVFNVAWSVITPLLHPFCWRWFRVRHRVILKYD